MIEFVSYDGKYPNLCSGTLKITMDGKLYELKHCLTSGGSIIRTDDGGLDATDGPWSVDLWHDEEKFPELLPHVKEIEDLVNENVRCGCCGGCI